MITRLELSEMLQRLSGRPTVAENDLMIRRIDWEMRIHPKKHRLSPRKVRPFFKTKKLINSMKAKLSTTIGPQSNLLDDGK